MGLGGGGQGQAGGMVTAAGIAHWALFLAHVRTRHRPKAAGPGRPAGGVGDSRGGRAAPPGRGNGPPGAAT